MGFSFYRNTRGHVGVLINIIQSFVRGDCFFRMRVVMQMRGDVVCVLFKNRVEEEALTVTHPIFWACALFMQIEG